MTVRPGRRSGQPDTRAEILQSARALFGQRGYNGATVRAIAAGAGVDPALVHYYFGTKNALFTAAIELPVPPAEVLRATLDANDSDPGRVLAETFFEVWERPDARSVFLGILRSAMEGEDRGLEAFRQFLTTAVIGQIAPQISGDKAPLRALLMASHLVGIAMARYVIRLEPIASAPVGDIVDLVSPRIQSYM